MYAVTKRNLTCIWTTFELKKKSGVLRVEEEAIYKIYIRLFYLYLLLYDCLSLYINGLKGFKETWQLN